MTDFSHSSELQELMAGYALGDLSPEEAEKLQQLLSAHPELDSELRQLQDVLAIMPYGLPEAVPPDRVRSKLLQESEAPPTTVPQTRSLPSIRALIKRHPRWAIAGGLAAIIALILGLDNLRLRQQLMMAQIHQRDLIVMLQRPNTYLVSLKGMNPLPAASGSIIVSSGQPEAILALQNLPILPKGQSYYLWTVVDGKRVASGRFNANAQGKVFVKLPLNTSSNLSNLVVTIEVSPSSDHPQGPMVMTSES